MKLRLMGAAGEVADAITVLRCCARLEVASVSDLLPTRGGQRGNRWVRAYLDAAVRAQHEPCHGALAAVWVGETTGPAGPLALWSCRACGGEWTTPVLRPEVTR